MLHIRGDLEIVINQLDGTYQVISHNIRTYDQSVRNLFDRRIGKLTMLQMMPSMRKKVTPLIEIVCASVNDKKRRGDCSEKIEVDSPTISIRLLQKRN